MLRNAEDRAVVRPGFRMPAEIIKDKKSGSVTWMPGHKRIFFGRGKIDGFCVYVAKPEWNNNRMSYETKCAAPNDSYYFSMCRYLADRYGDWFVYSHILTIGHMTGRYINKKVINIIYEFARGYNAHPDDKETAYSAFMMIYYGMIAEENKIIHGRPSRVGKVIKLLCLHKYIVEHDDLQAVCDCCKDQAPGAILFEAKQRGIKREYPQDVIDYDKYMSNIERLNAENVRKGNNGYAGQPAGMPGRAYGEQAGGYRDNVQGGYTDNGYYGSPQNSYPASMPYCNYDVQNGYTDNNCCGGHNCFEEADTDDWFSDGVHPAARA